VSIFAFLKAVCQPDDGTISGPKHLVVLQ